MSSVFAKTFGGRSRAYYFRQLFFALLFPLMFFGVLNAGSRPLGFPLPLIVMCVVNTLLYPYSRFVYEGVVRFIMGDTVLFGNVFFVLFVKYMTMTLCWSAAIFIAPIGLIYLYVHHSRESAST